jgi:hypothetical protein
MSLKFQSEIYKSGMLTTIEVHDHEYDLVEFVIKRNMLAEDGKTLVDTKSSMYFTNREFKDFFSQFTNAMQERFNNGNKLDSTI